MLRVRGWHRSGRRGGVAAVRVPALHDQRDERRARGASTAPTPLLRLQRSLPLRAAPGWTVHMQLQRLARRVSWGERGRRPADLQHSRTVAGLRDVGHAPCALRAFFVYGAEARHAPMHATTRPRVLPYMWRAKADRYSGVVSTRPKIAHHTDFAPCVFLVRHDVVCGVGS